jgi:hypothetical protein
MSKFVFYYSIAVLVVFGLLACYWINLDSEAIDWIVDLGLVVLIFADELAFVIFE